MCHCRVVSDRAITAAVAEGARTVAAACKATGAGRDCGTCVFSVRALLCQHLEEERGLVEVDGAAS
nr:(2Fe-2S)-binding protein [Nocardioides guangzhouensis]